MSTGYPPLRFRAALTPESRFSSAVQGDTDTRGGWTAACPRSAFLERTVESMQVGDLIRHCVRAFCASTPGAVNQAAAPQHRVRFCRLQRYMLWSARNGNHHGEGTVHHRVRGRGPW
jgi:hypothetical protein